MCADTLQFGDFSLDCGNYELTHRGHSVPVERKPMELLILLATRRGQIVTRSEIAATLWGNHVFVDTDSGINTAIRKIRYILHDDSGEPRFIQTVMGRGYRFVGQIETVPAPIEIPPIFAPVVSPPSTTRLVAGHLRSRALLLGLLVCAAAVALLAALHQRSTHSPTRIHSLAVLPLENLSGDPQQDYLADGMTDELITMLVRDSTLRIVPRSSVMQFKGAHRPPEEVARALHVDGLIEGSITRSGDNAHVNAQLIGIPNDTLLWAQSYDRSVGDSARLPSEIALTIARRLQSVAAQPAAQPVVNAAAHDAYLHGRYLWFNGKNGEAGKYFRKATELQPDYAPGWAGLAYYFGLGAVSGGQDPRISVPQAKAAALKAVQLDDSLPDAHLTLGGAYMFDWNLQAAQSEIDRAIQLNPSLPEPYHLRTRLDLALNLNAKAIEDQRTAMELDPFEQPWGMVSILKFARQYDAAIQEAQQRLEALPNNDTLYWELGQVYDRKGEHDKAVQAWEKMELLEGHNSNAATMRNTYQRGGWTALIKSFIADDEKQSASSYVSPFDLARYHAQLGEREKALSLLEEAYQQRSTQLLWIQTDPAFDFLHPEPRYQAIIRGIGLPPSY